MIYYDCICWSWDHTVTTLTLKLHDPTDSEIPVPLILTVFNDSVLDPLHAPEYPRYCNYKLSPAMLIPIVCLDHTLGTVQSQ